MIKFRWTTHLRRVSLVCALGLGILSALAPVARAQDDDSDDGAWYNADKRLFKSLMTGLGLQNDYGAGIQYQERAPLVVPPNNNLPPPQTTAARPSPAWPTDPEVKRASDAKKKKRVAADPDSWADPVSPSQLGPRNGPAVAVRPTTTRGDRDDDGNTMRPSDLGYFGGLFSSQSFGFGRGDDETGTFTREPPRTALTDPPVGYQTPSPAQPYGMTKRDDAGSQQPHDSQLDGLGN